MIDLAALESLLADFLPRQRWSGSRDKELVAVKIGEHELLQDGTPSLLWLLADTSFADGTTLTYQVLVGTRPLSSTERFLEGKGRGILGDVDSDDGPLLVYDALVDPDLALAVGRMLAPDQELTSVRALNVEQSNTSIVFDERWILKVFRVIGDGPNPDVEITRQLARVGFRNISAPVAEWTRNGRDLAVLREFLRGAVEGWALAQTSLRDLYDSRADPSQSGGDFAPEARRLGEITAAMHVALARAFGAQPGAPDRWTDDMEAHLRRVDGDFDRDAISHAYQRLRTVASPGASIRAHGDFHLGQTLRADDGWYVLDFEGEPSRPLEERRRLTSPLRDVAGMLRSFHYASQVGLLERGTEVDDELSALAAVWEQRAADAFLDGYLDNDDVAELLPRDDTSLLAVLDAFTLDKAVYEIGYELAHRPAWAAIPRAAVDRLVVPR